jgi:outer membrane autotransporter protein
MLTSGTINGKALDLATVDFTGSFTLSGSGSIGPYATLTGGVGSTFSQSNALTTMSGSVTVDTYSQQGGTVDGSIDAADYKLTGGTINGIALDLATVDFTGSFTLAGNSELGLYSIVTGDVGATFTQNNGHMRGTVDADSYELTGGWLDGAANVGSFVLANEGGDFAGEIIGGVNFASTFDMSGNTVITEDATITGEADSVFTQDAGTIRGNVSVGTYAIDACFEEACAEVADTATIDASTAFDVSLASGTADISGKLTGTGELKKSGGSTLVLANAVNDYTGATTVTGGVLQVDGAITASATTVSGGTLTGIGSLGAVTIASGGTHMAGDGGDGAQTINGSYVNHGTLAVELTPATAGQVVVNGTVDIAGATLDLRQLTNDGWSPTADFTLIDNDGDDEVTGSFASVESAYAFLVPGISTEGGDGNDVVLTLLRNDVGFSQVGATGNQRATAAAIETLGAGNPIYDGILWLSDEQAQQAFAYLSGEAFASAKGALLSTAALTTGVLLDRTGLAFGALHTSEPSGYAPVEASLANDGNGRFWTAGYGAWHGTGADANVAATNGTTAGIVAGLDTELAGWTLGVAAGAGQSAMAVPELGSDIRSTDLMLGAYAGSQWDALELALGASYTRHLLSSRRDVDFPSPQVLTADYVAGTTQIFGRIGVPVDLGDIDVTPFGEASYARLDTDAMAETGGGAALSSDASTTDAAMARLGISASSSRYIGDGMLLRFSADAAWQHGSGDAPTAVNSFAGSDAFAVVGGPTASDMLAVGIGIDLDASENLQFHLAYDGAVADDAQSHKLSAAVLGGF